MVLNFYNLKYSILDLGNCYLYLLYKSIGAVVAIIVWLLDLLLPMQSVPITTNVVSLNPLRRGVLNTTSCDKVCQ